VLSKTDVVLDELKVLFTSLIMLVVPLIEPLKKSELDFTDMGVKQKNNEKPITNTNMINKKILYSLTK